MLARRRTRALLLVACLIASWTGLAASASLRLRLVDPDGNPYPRVEVSVVGRTGAAHADDDGVVELLAPPPPPFEVAVFDPRGALIGIVAVASVPASAEDGGGAGPLELVLQPRATERVTVLSGAAPSTAAPPAAAATVFSAAENEERRPERLVEALEEIPGASKVGSGPTAAPSLRGLARGRTLILLDDARVTAERRAGPSATFLNPFALESVEVIRGPGSVAYGSDALGGVIHGRTPQPRPGELSGRYEIGAGVGEEVASAAVEVNAPVGSGAILAQVHARDTEDYESPEGEVDNSSSRDRGGLVRALIPTGKRDLVLGLQVDRASDTERPRDDPSSARTVYPTEESDRFTLGTELPPVVGFSTLELQAFAGRYRLVTDRIRPGTVETIERADVESDDGSLRLVGTRPLPEGMLRLGLDVSSRFNLKASNSMFERATDQPKVRLSESAAIEDARKITTGVFVEAQRVLNKLSGSLAVGLRGDYVDTENSGGTFGDRSTSESSPSGYVALSLGPARSWNTTVQYARGFRDARLSDRYFSGVTGRGTIVGNPDLDPETSEQFDVALHATLGRVRLQGYAYHYRIEDLIERFRVQADLFNFRNRGEVELQGVEIEADIGLPKRMDLRFTGNWAEGEVKDDGSDPDDVPPESLTVSLRQRVGERAWWRVVVAAFDRDEHPGGNEKITPGYAVVDAAAGVDLGRGLEARLFVRNVADKRYPASSADDSPLAAGRSFGFVLAGRF
jgi:outer membrane receptor protein involved in Fe transport